MSNRTLRNVAAFMKSARQNTRNRKTGLPLTQRAFATKLGVSRGFLSEIEAGTKKISVDTLVMFARKLDTTTDEILGLD